MLFYLLILVLEMIILIFTREVFSLDFTPKIRNPTREDMEKAQKEFQNFKSICKMDHAVQLVGAKAENKVLIYEILNSHDYAWGDSGLVYVKQSPEFQTGFIEKYNIYPIVTNKNSPFQS